MAKGRTTDYIAQKRRTLAVLQTDIDSIISVEVNEKQIQKLCRKVAKYLEQAEAILSEAQFYAKAKDL